MIKNWQEMEVYRLEWDVPIFCLKHEQEGRRIYRIGGFDALKPSVDSAMDFAQPQ